MSPPENDSDPLDVSQGGRVQLIGLRGLSAAGAAESPYHIESRDGGAPRPPLEAARGLGEVDTWLPAQRQSDQVSPERRHGPRADRVDYPGLVASQVARTGELLPILDGRYCAPLTPSLGLDPAYPPPVDDPCAKAGHDHSDRRGGVDLPCSLAGFFLGRAGCLDTRSLWLVTNTHDPRRLAPGRGPLAVRDRVGHAAALRAAEGWYEHLRARDPEADVLYGLEAHKSGARHAHALVATGADFRFAPVAGWWFEHHGFSRWDPVRVPEAAGRYAGKYVTKELGVFRLAFDGGVFK
jgi:hypothetical protein